MNKSILNSKLAYWIKGIYQIGIDKHEKLTVNSAMDTERFSEIIENAPPKSVCKIAFIVQGIAKFSGGYYFGFTIRNIFGEIRSFDFIFGLYKPKYG